MSAEAAPDDDLQDLRTATRSERVARLFDFEPFDYQRKILDSEANHNAVVCGRQVGKTEVASAIPADYALTHANADVAIYARFQETADELFRRTKQHLENTGLSQEELGVTKGNTQTYEFDNGSRIMSRTLGNDASQERGKLPECIVVEEAALVDDVIFERVIEPMFATHDDYEFYLISTPAGKSGYLYEKFTYDDAFASFHVPTSESPLVSEEWLADRRESTDDLTWRQEYLGEFVEEGEVYLPRSLVEPCVGTPKKSHSKKCWLGVDVARQGRDRTVYCGIDETGHVFLLESEQTSTVTGIVGRIKSLHEEHRFAGIRIDENAVGGGVVDFSTEGLGRVVEAVAFTTNSKQAMYQTLKKSFEEQTLTLPENDRLVHELTSLQFDFTQHGKLKVSHPPGGHDDYPDALALANEGRKTDNTVSDGFSMEL